MANRQAYYIAVQITGDSIIVREQLDRSADVPTTQLHFSPPRTERVIPVTVYWKTGTVEALTQEHFKPTILNYCARLFAEQDYEGPVNCCL